MSDQERRFVVADQVYSPPAFVMFQSGGIMRQRCNKGHEWTGVPFTLHAEGGEKAYDTKPVCPFCFVQAAERNFPAEVVEGPPISDASQEDLKQDTITK